MNDTAAAPDRHASLAPLWQVGGYVAYGIATAVLPMFVHSGPRRFPTVMALVLACLLISCVCAAASAPTRNARAVALSALVLWATIPLWWLCFGSRILKFEYLYSTLAYALTTYGVCRARAPRFATMTQIAFAAIVGAFGASSLRQVVFEVQSQGGISSIYDFCAAALFSFGLPVLVIGALGAATILWYWFWPAYARTDRPSRIAEIGAFAVAASLGIWFGWSSWADMQINTPCL